MTSTPHDGSRTRLLAGRGETIARLAALQRDFAAVVESARQANSDDEHDPEGSTLAFERQHLAALIEAARLQLAEVEAALGRIADGRYGRCAGCGEPIAEERLEARPTATACIRCAGRR